MALDNNKNSRRHPKPWSVITVLTTARLGKSCHHTPWIHQLMAWVPTLTRGEIPPMSKPTTPPPTSNNTNFASFIQPNDYYIYKENWSRGQCALKHGHHLAGTKNPFTVVRGHANLQLERVKRPKPEDSQMAGFSQTTGSTSNHPQTTTQQPTCYPAIL